MTQHAFFQHYMYGSEVDERGRPRMLKVKDWPPDEHFRVRMVRHNQVRRRRGSSVQFETGRGENIATVRGQGQAGPSLFHTRCIIHSS